MTSASSSNSMAGLEMEEVEGLISIQGPSNVGSNRKRSAKENPWDKCVAGLLAGRKRGGALVALVAVAFFLVWMAAGSDTTANGGGLVDQTPKDTHHDNDVTKEPVDEKPDADDTQTTPPPTLPPTTPPPTPPATPPPTPEPPKTDLNIPQLDPDPFHEIITTEQRDAITAKWGQFHFWDGDADHRPKDDFVKKYPNSDIPGEKFPENSWQVDAVYVNHFLNDADKLVTRAMEAIFTEYGHGKPLKPEQMMERMKMFHWEMVNLDSATGPPKNFAKRGERDTGGWTTRRSHEGLVRRLLHAMMTRDTFTVVLGGHSAAMGAGNHFRQSYTMQFHKIMFPIFSRLGVKLITRNISQGGLGTVQAALASGSIYGDEVDLLIWDSGMTEGQKPEHVDLFLRQGLIGGNRVPVLWGGLFPLLKMLHEECDADVGENGLGTVGVPITVNETQAETLPFAARYFVCDKERQDLCSDRFRSTCWIDREDGIKPEAKQYDRLKGQVKWHPGWRVHQLEGRVIAFQILEALQSAINTWSEATMSGQPLDDSYWHVTEYYENIRKKVKNLDKSHGDCYKIEGTLPTRICNTPMKGRTQYTPRANFEESGITSILKPAADGYIPKNEKVALYEGPDVLNPNYDIPEGEIDVLAIVMNRRRRLGRANVTYASLQSIPSLGDNPTKTAVSTNQERKLDDPIVPGKGWEVFDEPQGVCDGEYLSVCGLSTDNPCVLEGKHDARGVVLGSELSGWLVMELKGLKEGMIVLKLHTWHYESENPRTKGWKGINNETDTRQRRLGSRHLISQRNKTATAERERTLMRDYTTPELPDTFFFDYAINGNISSLNKTEFLAAKQQLQRVVETLTLLDDPAFTKGQEKDVELAIRLRGCGRKCVFGLSHVYWA